MASLVRIIIMLNKNNCEYYKGKLANAFLLLWFITLVLHSNNFNEIDDLYLYSLCLCCDPIKDVRQQVFNSRLLYLLI